MFLPLLQYLRRRGLKTVHLHATSYVVTGVLTAYLNQLISYEGLHKESTLILPFAAYLGMFGVVIFPESFFTGDSQGVMKRKDEGEVEEKVRLA